LSSGTLEIPSIPAGKSSKVALSESMLRFKSTKDVFLSVTLRLRESSGWAEAGHEIAWFQSQLARSKPDVASAPPLNQLSSPLSLKKIGASKVIISGHDFAFTFDTARGYLSQWTRNGVVLLQEDAVTGAAIMPSFWRPPTDNDRPLSLPYWQRFGVDTLTSQLRGLTISNQSGVTITTRTFLSPPVLAWGVHATTTYKFSPTGSVAISLTLQPSGAAPTHVPRAGLDLRLPRLHSAAADASQNKTPVSWLGLGPGESYPDKSAAQRVAVWEVEDVDDLHFPYDVPQESGNRMRVRWVKVTEGKTGWGLRAVAEATEGEAAHDEGFSFAVLKWTAEEVDNARHPKDLNDDSDALLLRLDYKVAGVGSATCGPGVREDLLVAMDEMRFGFVLEPVGL
jgi:beta-galactosidase